MILDAVSRKPKRFHGVVRNIVTYLNINVNIIDLIYLDHRNLLLAMKDKIS